MQINRNNNYQQKTNFGMIRLPSEKNGKAINYARSQRFSMQINNLRDKGLIALGRDKSFNLIEYITTRFNSVPEKEILESLQKSSRVKIKTVDQITGMEDIKRQLVFKKICNLRKTRREDFPAKFEKAFPDTFK